MFCPNCSEKQVSDGIKFCSRCGFLLEDVSEALKNEGRVERNVIQSSKDLKFSTVKGVSIMTLGGIFLLVSLVIGTPEPSYFVQFNLLVGILAFLFGMGLIAYDFWIKPKFIEKEEDLTEEKVVLDSKKPKANQLNEPNLSNISDYIPPQTKLDTNDLKQPASVTEKTTRNLKTFEK